MIEWQIQKLRMIIQGAKVESIQREIGDTGRPVQSVPGVRGIKSKCHEFIMERDRMDVNLKPMPSRGEYTSAKTGNVTELSKTAYACRLKNKNVLKLTTLKKVRGISNNKKIFKVYAEYLKIKQPARAEYLKIKQTARAEFENALLNLISCKDGLIAIDIVKESIYFQTRTRLLRLNLSTGIIMGREFGKGCDDFKKLK